MIDDTVFRVTFKVESDTSTETHLQVLIRVVDLNGWFFASNHNVHEPYQGQGTSPDLAILNYLKQRLSHRDIE
jgi:hypothetical protein